MKQTAIVQISGKGGRLLTKGPRVLAEGMRALAEHPDAPERTGVVAFLYGPGGEVYHVRLTNADVRRIALNFPAGKAVERYGEVFVGEVIAFLASVFPDPKPQEG